MKGKAIFKVDQCCQLEAVAGLLSDVPQPFSSQLWYVTDILKGAFSRCLLLSGELIKLAKRCPSLPLLGTVCENQNQIRKRTVQAASREGGIW